MITSTLLVYSMRMPAILFDSSTTHTFIHKTFVDRIGVSIEHLVYDLIVSTPSRAVLTIIVCVRGVTVLFQ